MLHCYGMLSYVSTIRSNHFFKQNIVFFVGSVSVGALNYLYYPVIGRLMTPSAFGEVQTLISLFLQLTIFLNVLSLVAVNLITNSKDESARRIVTELQLAALWVAGLSLLVTTLLAAGLKEALQFSSGWPFVLLVIALVVAVPFAFQTAYLRAAKRFASTSIANLVVAGGKLILSALLVLIGFGTAGAIGGLIAAQLIGLGYALSRTKLHPHKIASTLKKRWWPDIPVVMGELRYVGFALVGLLSVILLLSLDVILVKYFFDAHTAGLYAGVATVARIIFFLTASVAQVLLPSVKMDAVQHENPSLLKKSLLILTGLSLPVLLLAWIAPSFVMSLLMGHQYLEFSNLLAPLSLAVFFISVLNLLVSYCLALRSYFPIVLTAAGTVLTFAAIMTWHDSLQTIVMTLLGGAIGVTSVVGVWFLAKRSKV